MLDLSDARRLLEEAERAASDADFASADRLLREAARIQEAELGPLHPDLANTLNNLAIVAENTGQPADAERFYRRAAAIASAALPADHPMVEASRRNLEDFCHASGLAIDAPAFMTPSAHETELGLSAFAPEDEADVAEPRVAVPAPTPTVGTPPAAPAASATPAAPAKAPAPPAIPPASPLLDVADLPLSTTPSAATAPRSSSRAWLVVVAGLVVAAALAALRPWEAREDVLQPAVTDTARDNRAPKPAAPAAQPPAAAANPAALPARDTAAAIDAPALTSTDGISLATAQVCARFAASGSTWQCDPIGAAVAPGTLVFYTRVRAARDVAVVHRWYHGDTLMRAAKLATRANATEGFRTYSRLAVSSPGEWRVEVTTAGGERLHEQRFTVQ